MTADEARDRFSDYLDGTLDAGTRDEMQAFLAAHPDGAAELIAFERTLTVLRRLPPREPSLDLWREFAPRMEAFTAERKTRPLQRFAQRWTDALAQISAGIILWTHALAGYTHARLEKYLLHDPLSHDTQRQGR